MIMKKSNYYLLLLAGALGVAGATVFSAKPALATPGDETNAPADTVQTSCCMGADDPISTPETNAPADANIKPDLLTTCPVSGEKLGEMGKAFVFTNNMQEVKLCCPNCKADFDKEPAKYLAKIRAADKK
jgi:hypothetical protein